MLRTSGLQTTEYYVWKKFFVPDFIILQDDHKTARGRERERLLPRPRIIMWTFKTDVMEHHCLENEWCALPKSKISKILQSDRRKHSVWMRSCGICSYWKIIKSKWWPYLCCVSYFFLRFPQCLGGYGQSAVFFLFLGMCCSDLRSASPFLESFRASVPV